MMEKQCSPEVQKKLVDYTNQGGQLLLAGRMCVEDFDHNPCTILKEAVGIENISSDPPFTASNMTAFEHEDMPVRFVETYSGRFDEVFARRKDDVVGFVKAIGSGRILVIGAAFTTNTLDDLDVVNQMALKMGSQPLFTLSTWADVRISRGERGSFFFINNYLDDPIETTVVYEGTPIFGGNPISLPARRGLILPVEWQLNEDILVHYATAEIIEVIDYGESIVLKTEPAEFTAEITTATYRCNGAAVPNPNQPTRLKIDSANGEIVLQKHQ
jgi:beta-galactosidase